MPSSWSSGWGLKNAASQPLEFFRATRQTVHFFRWTVRKSGQPSLTVLSIKFHSGVGPMVGRDNQESSRMDPPTFRELRNRYGSHDLAATTWVRLDRAHDNPEGQNVLRYLRGFGFRITTADELFLAINSLEDEEELSAFRCREGVAVSHASEGWWLLFEHPTVSASK